MFRNRLLSIVVITVAALYAGAASAGSPGTTLRVTKSAAGTIGQTDTYSWRLAKTPTPNQEEYVTIRQGFSDILHFSIDATRSGPVSTYGSTGVSGEICVTNLSNTIETRGLYITDQLGHNVGNVFTPIAGVNAQVVPLTAGAEVPPSTTLCYPYTINYELAPEQAYMNRATIWIDNYLNYEGTTHDVIIDQPVAVTTHLTEIQKEMVFTDIVACPAGFGCTPTGMGPVTLSGTTHYDFDIAVTNNTAACGSNGFVVNNAYLNQPAPGLFVAPPYSASAQVQIYTGACRPTR